MPKPSIVTSTIVSVLAAFAAWTPLVHAQEKPYQGTTIRVGCQSSQWANVSKKMAPEFTAETGIKVEFEDIPYLSLIHI